MTKPELEARLEDRCVAKIEARGGLALKLRPPTGRGFPDRAIYLPRTRPVTLRPGEWRSLGPGPSIAFFVEFKRAKVGVVAAQQTEWRRVLMQAGFGVYVIDNDADFDAALEKELNR